MSTFQKKQRGDAVVEHRKPVAQTKTQQQGKANPRLVRGGPVVRDRGSSGDYQGVMEVFNRIVKPVEAVDSAAQVGIPVVKAPAGVEPRRSGKDTEVLGPGGVMSIGDKEAFDTADPQINAQVLGAKDQLNYDAITKYGDLYITNLNTWGTNIL